MSDLFEKPDRKVHTVFVHCSASDRAAHDDVSVMERWHKERGWSGVGYHGFIKKDGTYQAGRSLERTPAAQGGNNTGTLAYCLHGLVEERFTEAQFGTILALCEEINQAYGGSMRFRGHCEVAAKACPVFDYKKVLGLNAAGYMTQKPSRVPPDVSVPPVFKRGTLRMFDRGEEVKRLQESLNAVGYFLVEDGIFGRGTKQAVQDFQRAQGLVPDGVVGPKTWGALVGNPAVGELP